jgi:hypothetical protein
LDVHHSALISVVFICPISALLVTEQFLLQGYGSSGDFLKLVRGGN